MSQERIIELLQKGKPLTRAELKEITELSNQALCHALKQLIKFEEIIKGYSDSNTPIYTLKRKIKKRRRVL